MNITRRILVENEVRGFNGSRSIMWAQINMMQSKLESEIFQDNATRVKTFQRL